MKKVPFTLEAWLKDKSQKVETRDGRSVRIIYTDYKGNYPIVAIVSSNDEIETIETYHVDGHYWTMNEAELDLFLITETEDEMTEFEEELAEVVRVAIYQASIKPDKPIIDDFDDFVKCHAKNLISIAKKMLKADGCLGK